MWGVMDHVYDDSRWHFERHGISCWIVLFFSSPLFLMSIIAFARLPLLFKLTPLFSFSTPFLLPLAHFLSSFSFLFCSIRIRILKYHCLCSCCKGCGVTIAFLFVLL
ncbi:hypothetical protein HOY82DRAFT_238428 [Tuber indicum]|nr:hypothetical protein HOY82DRAFT_238428 [Tuber indicum]